MVPAKADKDLASRTVRAKKKKEKKKWSSGCGRDNAFSVFAKKKNSVRMECENLPLRWECLAAA